MAKLTRMDIDNSVGQTVFYLLGISIFLFYKLFYSLNVEYIIILSCCILGIICTYRVGNLLKKGLSSDGTFRTGFLDNIVTSFGLMIILGGLSLYLVFYKGFYGLYELFNDFSWFLFFFRILVIFVGSKLVFSLDKLQTGFKMIEKGNYSVENVSPES